MEKLMSYQEIVDLIEQIKKNPNMINDINYLEKIKNLLIDLGNYMDEDKNVEEYIENNAYVIKEIVCNPKFIDRYLNNDRIFEYFLEFNLENLDEISPKY